jgi:hypothetical protein
MKESTARKAEKTEEKEEESYEGVCLLKLPGSIFHSNQFLQSFR